MSLKWLTPRYFISFRKLPQFLADYCKIRYCSLNLFTRSFIVRSFEWCSFVSDFEFVSCDPLLDLLVSILFIVCFVQSIRGVWFKMWYLFTFTGIEDFVCLWYSLCVMVRGNGNLLLFNRAIKYVFFFIFFLLCFLQLYFYAKSLVLNNVNTKMLISQAYYSLRHNKSKKNEFFFI